MSKANTSKNRIFYLIFFTMIWGLIMFCLSIFLVRSRQHIMQYGYKISQLEHSCSIYHSRIIELDRKILELSSNSNIVHHITKNCWCKNNEVIHIKKKDIQYFALTKRLKTNQVVAQNSQKQN